MNKILSRPYRFQIEGLISPSVLSAIDTATTAVCMSCTRRSMAAQRVHPRRRRRGLADETPKPLEQIAKDCDCEWFTDGPNFYVVARTCSLANYLA